MNIKKIFGQNLKQLREAKGLTQEQLAELLNLQTYQTINRIENGKTYVGLNLLEKICKLFSIEPYILYIKPKQTYLPETVDKLDTMSLKIDKIYNFLKQKSL